MQPPFSVVPNTQHKKYVYLLRNVVINRVNQVWSTNIFNGESCSTRLSMDGKGRAFDNIFVERFWRTLKYEDVYLKGYETVVECRKGLGEYICKYNDIREHSSVDGNTPSDIYFGRVKLERAA